MTPDNQPRPPRTPGTENALRLCEEAYEHARQGRWDDALAAASRAIERDPDCLEAYQFRASLHLSQCDWSALIADLTEALRLDPGQAEAYSSRAFAYARTGQFERAILDCDRAVEIDSLAPCLYETRAYALFKLGREAEAQADLRRALLLASTPEETASRDRRQRIAALLSRGEQFLHAGQAEEAVRAFSAVLLECPSHVRARCQRGMAYRQAGRFQEASGDLAEAWQRKRRRERIARGYLVAVEGTHGGVPWATFPDNGKGEHAAIRTAEGLVKNTALVDEVRDRFGVFQRAIVYRFKGSEFEVIDRARFEEQQSKPATAHAVDLTQPPREEPPGPA